ncbi:DUF2510 domain-containing protein, partial [Mycolicibacterium stellerae]|uniref:DUF2510 domain-containing protein n=1 Tax=Mycolicibacterium stellerae TaxID=2358193 RepID=UPI002E15EBB1
MLPCLSGHRRPTGGIHSMTTPPTPAGWFPDPEQAGQLRYWDGAAWTEHRSPA